MKITRYLWINDLPKNCEEDDIIKTFQRHGKIQNIRIHSHLKTRGAVVAFIDCSSSTKAYQNVKTLQNMELKLEYCEANGEPGIKSLGLPNEYSKNGNISDSSNSQSRSSSSSSNTSSFGSSLDDYSKSPKKDVSDKSTDRSSSKSIKSGQTSATIIYKKESDNLNSDNRGILVENLSQRSSDTSLREGLFHEFKKHGKITSVAVMGQGNGRHAIISFKRSDDMAKAFNVCQGKTFFGNQMRLTKHNGYNYIDPDLCPPEHELDEYHPKATKTLFVGKLETGIVMEGNLRRVFKKYGEIIDIDIKIQANKQETSFAFVQYFDISSVVRALKHQDSITILGNQVKLGFGKSQPANCLWVGNLQRGANEDYLRHHFGRFGTVMLVVPDPEYSCALIQFETGDEALRAFTDTRERGNSVGSERIHVDYASNEYQMAFMNRLRQSCQFDSEDFLKNMVDPYQTEKLQTLLLSYTKYLELLDETRARSHDRYDDGDDYYHSSGRRHRRDRESMYNDEYNAMEDDGYNRYKRYNERYSSSRSPSHRHQSRHHHHHHHEPSSSSRHHHHHQSGYTHSSRSPEEHNDDNHRYNLSSARYNLPSKDYRRSPQDTRRRSDQKYNERSHSKVKTKKTRSDEEMKMKSTVETKSKPPSNGYNYDLEKTEKTVLSVVQPVDTLSKLERERAKLLAELSLLTEDPMVEEVSPSKTLKSVVKIADTNESRTNKIDVVQEKNARNHEEVSESGGMKVDMKKALIREEEQLIKIPPSTTGIPAIFDLSKDTSTPNPHKDKSTTISHKDKLIPNPHKDTSIKNPNKDKSTPIPPLNTSTPTPIQNISTPISPKTPMNPIPSQGPLSPDPTQYPVPSKTSRDPRRYSDLQSPTTTTTHIMLATFDTATTSTRTHRDSASDSDIDHMNSFDIDVDKRIRELDEKMTRSEQSVRTLDYSKFRIRKKTDPIIPSSPNSLSVSTSTSSITSCNIFDVGYSSSNRESSSATSDFIKNMLNQTKPNSYHLLTDSISPAPCSMLPFRTVDFGSTDLERRSLFSKFPTVDSKLITEAPLMPAYVPRLPTSTIVDTTTPEKVISSPTTPASAPSTPNTGDQSVKSILKKSNMITKLPEPLANKKPSLEVSLSVDVAPSQPKQNNGKPSIVDLKRKINSEADDNVKKLRYDYGPVFDDSLFKTYPTMPKKKPKKLTKKPDAIPLVVQKKSSISSPMSERYTTKRTHSNSDEKETNAGKHNKKLEQNSKSKSKASKRKVKGNKSVKTKKANVEAVFHDSDYDEEKEDMVVENGVQEVDYEEDEDRSMFGAAKYTNSKTKKKLIKEEVKLVEEKVDDCWSAKNNKKKKKKQNIMSDVGSTNSKKKSAKGTYVVDQVEVSSDLKRYSLRSKDGGHTTDKCNEEDEYKRLPRLFSDGNEDDGSSFKRNYVVLESMVDHFSSSFCQGDDLEEEVVLDDEHHEEENMVNDEYNIQRTVSDTSSVAADVNSASQILLTMRSQPINNATELPDQQRQQLQSVAEHLISLAQNTRDWPITNQSEEHVIEKAPDFIKTVKKENTFTIPLSSDHTTSIISSSSQLSAVIVPVSSSPSTVSDRIATISTQIEDKYSLQSDEAASTSSTDKRIRHISGKSDGQLQSLCETIDNVVKGSISSSVSDVISVKSTTDADDSKSLTNYSHESCTARKSERSSLDETMDDVISKVNVKSPPSNGTVRNPSFVNLPDHSSNSPKTLISREASKPAYYQFSGNSLANLVLHGIPSITIVSQHNSVNNVIACQNKLSTQLCQPSINYTITSQPINGAVRSATQVLPGNGQGIFAKLNSLTPLMIQNPMRSITSTTDTVSSSSTTTTSINMVSLAPINTTPCLNLSNIAMSTVDPNLHYVMMQRQNNPLTTNVPNSSQVVSSGVHPPTIGHSIILSQMSNNNSLLSPITPAYLTTSIGNRPNTTCIQPQPTNGMVNTCLTTAPSVLLRPLNIYFPKFEEKNDWLKQNSQPEWNYPIRWTGKLCLKNDEVFVQMHMVAGNEDLLRNCMNLIPTGQNSSQYLRIVQRMRLEPNQLEGLYRRLSRPIEFCTCLTLAGGDKPDELTRTSATLDENFIKYLQNKSAAGIINISVPGSPQNAYVIHIFPSCDFSDNQLKSSASKLYEKLKENSIPYLVIVITTS